MSIDIEAYRQKAQEAIESVFSNEYHSSLGIPMPEVKMLLADDVNYATGQYYITIDKTWQIHLNFGKLPISYKDFTEEVKVLTRHEIEHYMCCPFDVITHFRMLNRIIDVYNKNFSSLGINISYVCGSISNQAADIIVDTKNFIRHPAETLKSEINWIKKGADLYLCPRHNKLMFLTKEAIWGRSLEINETDTELLDIVNRLALKFQENGIEDKGSFLDKTEEYTKVFFKLYIKDKEESNSTHYSQQHNESLQQYNQPQGTQQESHQQGMPKDGDKYGSAFVFGDPDKIKEAIEAIANETSVKEFVDILNIAGISYLSEKDKESLWFKVRGSNMIPISETSDNGGRTSCTYPSEWKIGDPIEDLDVMLSYMTSPKLIPGITTKKWEFVYNAENGSYRKQMDLLLVVDTSGSMGCATKECDNMHQAVLASYGLLAYFESTNNNVALIEFNDTITASIEWSKNYDDIRKSLLVNGFGGTKFPILRIKNCLENKTNKVVTVFITDGDLNNVTDTVNYFREYLNDDNKLYIFMLGNSRTLASYEELRHIGAKVYNANNANDFCDLVISDID